MKPPVNVVILAAGLGTRMKSKRAKVLHRAGGLTLIEHVVRAATGITPPEHVTVVVGHQADQVKERLQSTGVRFVEQSEQRGTGHAVLACREALKSEGGLVTVLYGDCPLLAATTLRELIDRQRSSSGAVTLITTRLEDPTGYGRILVGKDGGIEAIVEQKAATQQQLAIQLINPGIYCFEGGLLWKHIAEIQPDNPAHEYYLTDMVAILNRAGHKAAGFEVPDASELLGINTRVELAAADKIFRDHKVRELMLDGVTIERPETVTIDGPVRIGEDSVIGPFAQILGRSAIGRDCSIGAGSIIQNSELGDEVQIAPLTIIADSRIAAGAQVGPFARLRPGNRVAEAAHIGNFVELKNTQLGARSKASHLAYLGDSEIGEQVNIGAGTIFCNYDGMKKHRTRIGKKAFVGSNSTLVAPIEIGEGSYIAAGSVITDKVPADALALGRARQVVKEGWTAKKKKPARE
jgi:bifunctional UDP-N-acetylglucosamine pyrophosphorylase/glucosamine-1-phosphate N-acetyltransferase